MRTIILFLILLSAAVFDMRLRKIPNIFSVLLAVNSLSNFENALEGIICVGVPMLLIACVSDQIGGGDVKLATAAAMNLCSFYAVLFVALTLIISAIYAKLAHKNSIPFAPFLFVSFFVFVSIGYKV